MSLLDLPIATLDGTPGTLADLTGGKPALLVNVASKCGLTPQYSGLEELARTNPDVAVVGFPCNQFGGQEPGSAEEIAEFCSATYGVTFPMSEKIDVNGPGRHPIYQALVGDGPDIAWNFGKFLISADGTHVQRFEPGVTTADAELIDAIAAL
ncbi:glutathione peroxidase [Nocardioides baekrokdamisoli]|uniref:Glutathione peroxidase n=1 Tax=Nocardioides baekrokdamisoli TaxID=1804624 RepID=A0A3G9IMT4_9ACTN|nr:glutathione peroxidase [Nocardioides baekrokdamisoli]BBH17335.1 glutathione peroxidase [Nocardioides baekrokdamisoli]